MARRGRLSTPVAPLTGEPDIAVAFVQAVTCAVRWGWSELQQSCPGLLAAGREEEITEALARLLNQNDSSSRRRAKDLDGFETVDRGAKVVSVDGHIERAPDLVFRPPCRDGVQNLGDWGLFVECKVIDAKASHHVPDFYCQKGVARFVRGEYAARMPTGMMLGYVRDRTQPHPTLDPLLQNNYATLSHLPGTTTDESSSSHDRAACRCVAIALRHVWLGV